MHFEFGASGGFLAATDPVVVCEATASVVDARTRVSLRGRADYGLYMRLRSAGHVT